jgi:cbb3-type cytochrome oxidase subunit 3
MAGTMTWMIVAMPMGAAAALLETYFLLAAVPWMYSAGRRKSADALCHAAMSLATGLMVLVR